MKYFITSLTASLALFSQTSSVVAATSVSAYTAIFPIDPSQRGTDLITMFTVLSGPPYNYKNTYEIAITTDVNGTIGSIPFINNIGKTTNNTLLIISYRLSAGGTAAQNKYVVLPIEQISEMIYSTSTITNLTSFKSTISSGVLPYYSINMAQRAADIQSAVRTLNTTAPYAKFGNYPIVSLTTTLTGPYYAGTITDGVIPYVQSVAAYGTLMVVTYQLTQANNIQQYIVVSPEQVISINYLGN